MRSFEGKNLVDFLSQTESKLIFPEIVEREVRRRYISEFRSSVVTIGNELRNIESLTDVKPDITLPNSEIASAALNKRLSTLDHIFDKPEFTFDHAKFALDMIQAKRPPCGENNEQFTDCCIWRDCVQYGKQQEVLFVTGDKGFYKGKNYEKGLADELSKCLARETSKVRIFSDLLSLYNFLAPEIRTAIKTKTAVSRKILDKLEAEITAAATRHGFTGATKTQDRISFRRSSQSTKRFVSFEFDFSLEGPVEETKRLNPVLTLRGSCAYDINNGDVSDVKLDSEIFSWTDNSGNRIKSTMLYLQASMSASMSMSAGTAIVSVSTGS